MGGMSAPVTLTSQSEGMSISPGHTHEPEKASSNLEIPSMCLKE